MMQFESGFDGQLLAARRAARRQRRLVLGLTAVCLGVGVFFAMGPVDKDRDVPAQGGGGSEYEVVTRRAMNLPGLANDELPKEISLADMKRSAMPSAAPAASGSSAPAPTAVPTPPVEKAPAAEVPPPPAPPAPAPAPPAAPATAATPSLAPWSSPASAEAPPQAAQAGQAGSAGPRIQLAAVRSETDAHRVWTQLQKTQGDLLGDRKLTVQKLAAPDGGVFWRVQTAVEDDAGAKRICGELQRRSIACFVVHR
jgi:SPOR domain